MNAIDMTGQKFGTLTVVERHGERHGSATWLCQCECGNTFIANGFYLRKGRIVSCGCKTTRSRDLTGMRFGRLTVKKMARPAGRRGDATRWLCICDCGNEIEVRGYSLTGGNTKSCGCMVRTLKHPKRENPRLYNVWSGMKSRCYDKNNSAYMNYGGRGITVCDDWLSYDNFYEWAMLNGYDSTLSKGKCTLDRIDSNKGYSPSNCRFADTAVQISNRRVTRWRKDVYLGEDGIYHTEKSTVDSKYDSKETVFKHELEKRKIKQADVHRITGISKPDICRIANGKEIPHSHKGKLIADAIGWEGDWRELFKDRHDTTSKTNKSTKGE